MKPLTWIASSLDDVKTFPAEARKEIGYQQRDMALAAERFMQLSKLRKGKS